MQQRETFAAVALPSGNVRVLALDPVGPGAVPVSRTLLPGILAYVLTESGCEVRGRWAELLQQYRHQQTTSEPTTAGVA